MPAHGSAAGAGACAILLLDLDHRLLEARRAFLDARRHGFQGSLHHLALPESTFRFYGSRLGALSSSTSPSSSRVRFGMCMLV